ncbi:MAG: ATP12 family protein [Rickettsiales bacterium]|jgi:chaperone required for assembly of F1-ATPase
MTLPTQTPAKNPFTLPSSALTEAVKLEWQSSKKYSPTNMPLTALAYTAIDKIASSKENIIEVLMVYVDSDTLTYRATGSELLAKRQEEEWGSVLKWAGARFDVAWQTTSGVMPVEQSPLLHTAITQYLESLDEWKLSVFCVLASGFSSLVLAIAVCEEHLDAQKAFLISRLEEESQAEQWGRDDEAEARAQKMKEEIVAAEQFLRLL